MLVLLVSTSQHFEKKFFFLTAVFFLRLVPHCITGELKQNKSESLWELVTCLLDPNLWNMHPAGQVSDLLCLC